MPKRKRHRHLTLSLPKNSYHLEPYVSFREQPQGGVKLTRNTQFDNFAQHDNARMNRCLLGGVYVPCIHRMPGGGIVGDSGLCYRVPILQYVICQLYERN